MTDQDEFLRQCEDGEIEPPPHDTSEYVDQAQEEQR